MAGDPVGRPVRKGPISDIDVPTPKKTTETRSARTREGPSFKTAPEDRTHQ